MWEDLGCSQLLRKASNGCLEPQSYPGGPHSLPTRGIRDTFPPKKVIFTMQD